MKIPSIAAAAFFLAAGLASADKISGRVDSVDPEAGALEISGVKVSVREGGLEKGSLKLPAIKTGDRLEVGGAFTGPGKMAATEIERESGPNDVIEGTVSEQDDYALTVIVGGVTVYLRPETEIRDTGGKGTVFDSLVPGARVECEGSWGAPMAFQAKKVKLED